MELTKKQKETLFRFHIKDKSMTDVANELDVAPGKAFQIYKETIGDIINEFKDKGYYQIKFLDDEQPREEPEPEDVPPAPEPDYDVKETPEPVLDIKEEPEQKPESTKPVVKIDQDTINKIVDDDRMIVIEEADFATEVALFFADDNKDAIFLMEDPAEKIEGICICPKNMLLDIDNPHIMIRPVYNAEENIINIKYKKVN